MNCNDQGKFPYQQGFDAGKSLLKFMFDNPYIGHDPARAEWARGFNRGRWERNEERKQAVENERNPKPDIDIEF